jgi:hypothetical protein
VLGTVIAAVAVLAAAALAVRSAGPAAVAAPSGPSEAVEPSPEPLPPSNPPQPDGVAVVQAVAIAPPVAPADPVPQVDLDAEALAPPAPSPNGSGPGDAETLTGPIPGLPVFPLALPAPREPSAVATQRTVPPRPQVYEAPRIADDRSLEDVLQAAAEIAPARGSAGARLALGITVLSFVFAAATLLAVKGISAIMTRLLH